jgi:hypothetical protein
MTTNRSVVKLFESSADWSTLNRIDICQVTLFIFKTNHKSYNEGQIIGEASSQQWEAPC